MKVALAPFLGPDDIVIGSWSEILDSGCPLNQAAQTTLHTFRGQVFYWAARSIGKTVNRAKGIGIDRWYRGKLSKIPQHPTAPEAKAFFPKEWESYYKFSFVRNPWQRIASDYYWRKRSTGKQFGFATYLDLLLRRDSQNGVIHPDGVRNWEMISIDDQIQMDFVGRYENVNEDFKAVCAEFGFPVDGLFHSAKKNSAKSDYGDLYGQNERDIVRQICAPEIEQFGYEFPY